MFNPYNLLFGVVGLYLLLPIIGFGLYPEYFDFTSNIDNFIVLGSYISVMLSSAWLAKKIEALNSQHRRVKSKRWVYGKWSSLSQEQKSYKFIFMITALSSVALLMVIIYSKVLLDDFSPHEFRMGVAHSGDLGLVITYNAVSLFILASINLAFISLVSSYKKIKFWVLIGFLFLLIIATGQRSMIVLAALSYLFVKSKIEKRELSFATLSILVFVVGVVIAMGVVRQGDEFNYGAFIWQVAVRFDLFYPQFFNFLDVYRNLNDIGYGYFHFTYPLQLIPSSLMDFKPVTFLHFVNRDLMNIADGTGNDFTAFSEFIYNYGILLGLFFYFIYCFIASFIIHRIYRFAGESPIFCTLYFPSFLIYISLVLLTGLSNQAHIFSMIGILGMILVAKLFVKLTNPKIKMSCTVKAVVPAP